MDYIGVMDMRTNAWANNARNLKIVLDKRIEFCYSLRIMVEVRNHRRTYKVAKQMLGRDLYYDEVIHHKDEDPTNDDPSNLQVLTVEEHFAVHVELRAKKKARQLKWWQLQNGSLNEFLAVKRDTYEDLYRHWPRLIKLDLSEIL